MQTLLDFPPQYRPTKLKSLPLREQPAYRVSANVTACSLAELLAVIVGGAKQIEVAEDLLAHFKGDLRRLYHEHVAEIARVPGVPGNSLGLT